jgi:transglutaminase/protease-like cytokinesis protein 3
MRNTLIFLILTLINLPAISQDYAKADKIALSIAPAYTFNTQKLSIALTKDLSDEFEKHRAIYKWICHNIKYSYAGLKDCSPATTLKNKYAVCQGYAELYDSLCKYSALKSWVVKGYAKNELAHIGYSFDTVNHAWNVIEVNAKKYLIDACWGAGSYSNKFIRKFDENCFLANPDAFKLNHLPKENQSHLQLTNFKINKQQFSTLPLYYTSYYADSLRIISSDSGFIKAHVGDTLTFRFKLISNPKTYYYQFNTEGFSTEINFIAQKNTMICLIPVTDKRATQLTLFNRKAGLVAYKVQIE